MVKIAKRVRRKRKMKYIDKIMGCLYGGAIGDALGYPVEFLSTKEIVEIYGRDGIRDYACSEGKALISDDTQMTLFTLGGLLAWRGDQERGKNKDSWKEYVWKSYQKCLPASSPCLLACGRACYACKKSSGTHLSVGLGGRDMRKHRGAG